MTTTSATLVAASYILGAVPFGLLFARMKGVDIRAVGSKNIGATNVFRSVSKPLGILTFVCDALKGFVPAFVFPMIGKVVSGEPAGSSLGLLCGCAAIAGHNWPVFLRFKGGKGISTSAGALLGIAPAAVGFGFLSWLLLLVTTRYMSVASIGAAIAVPVSSWIQHAHDSHVLPSALSVLGVLAVWRHRSNIGRLIAGTEHRFSFGRQESEDRSQKSGVRSQKSEVGDREMRGTE